MYNKTVTLTGSQPDLCIRAGREIIKEDADALFAHFRQAEAALQAYIAKFPDGSRERYLLISRYRSQLKRWLADYKREVLTA